jgi:hypothetical protein
MEKNVFNVTFKQIIAYIKKYKGFGFVTAPAKTNLERKNNLSVNIKNETEPNLSGASSSSSSVFDRDGTKVGIDVRADLRGDVPMETDVSGHPIPITHITHTPGEYGGYRLVPHTADPTTSPMFRKMLEDLTKEIALLTKITEGSSRGMPELAVAITDAVRELREPRVVPAAAMPLAEPIKVEAKVPGLLSSIWGSSSKPVEPVTVKAVVPPIPVLDASAIKIDAEKIGKAIDVGALGKAIALSMAPIVVPPIEVPPVSVRIDADMSKLDIKTLGKEIASAMIPITVPPITVPPVTVTVDADMSKIAFPPFPVPATNLINVKAAVDGIAEKLDEKLKILQERIIEAEARREKELEVYSKNMIEAVSKINVRSATTAPAAADSSALRESEEKRIAQYAKHAEEITAINKKLLESRTAAKVSSLSSDFVPSTPPSASSEKFPTRMDVTVADPIKVNTDLENPLYVRILNKRPAKEEAERDKAVTDALSKIATNTIPVVDTDFQDSLLAELAAIKNKLLNVENLKASEIEAIVAKSALLMKSSATEDYSSKINDVLASINALFQSMLSRLDDKKVDVKEISKKSKLTSVEAPSSTGYPFPPPGGGAGALAPGAVDALTTQITLLTQELMKSNTAKEVTKEAVVPMDTTAKLVDVKAEVAAAYEDFKKELPGLFAKITIAPPDVSTATDVLSIIKKMETTMNNVGTALEKGDTRMVSLASALNALTERTTVEFTNIKVEQNINKNELETFIKALKNSQDLITNDQFLIKQLLETNASKDDQIATSINNLNTINNDRYVEAINNLSNATNLTADNLNGAMKEMRGLTTDNQKSLNTIIEKAKLSNDERSELISQLDKLTSLNLAKKMDTSESGLDDNMGAVRSQLSLIMRILENQAGFIGKIPKSIEDVNESLTGLLTKDASDSDSPVLQSIAARLDDISKQLVTKVNPLMTSEAMVPSSTRTSMRTPRRSVSRSMGKTSTLTSTDERDRSPLGRAPIPVAKAPTTIHDPNDSDNFEDASPDLNDVSMDPKITSINTKRALEMDLEEIDTARNLGTRIVARRTDRGPTTTGRRLSTMVDLDRVRNEILAKEIQRRKEATKYGAAYNEFSNIHKSALEMHSKIIGKLATLDSETAGLIAVGGASNIGGGTKPEALRTSTGGYAESAGATVNRNTLNSHAEMIGLTLHRQQVLLNLMHTNSKANRRQILEIASHLNTQGTNIMTKSNAARGLKKNTNCPSCGLKYGTYGVGLKKINLKCGDSICDLCVKVLGETKCYVDWSHNTSDNKQKENPSEAFVAAFQRPKMSAPALDVVAGPAGPATTAQGTTAKAQEVALGIPPGEANYGLNELIGPNHLAARKYRLGLKNMEKNLSILLKTAKETTGQTYNFSVAEPNLVNKIFDTKRPSTPMPVVLKNMLEGMGNFDKTIVVKNLEVLLEVAQRFNNPARENDPAKDTKDSTRFKTALDNLTGTIGPVLDVINPLATILNPQILVDEQMPILQYKRFDRIFKAVKQDIKARVQATAKDKSLYGEYLSKSTAPTTGITTATDNGIAKKPGSKGSKGDVCGRCNIPLGDDYYEVIHANDTHLPESHCMLCTEHGLQSFETGKCLQCKQEVDSVDVAVSKNVISDLISSEKLINAPTEEIYDAEKAAWKETTMMYLRGEITYDDYLKQGTSPITSEQLSELKEAYNSIERPETYNDSIGERAIAMEANPPPGPRSTLTSDVDADDPARKKKINNGQAPVTDIINKPSFTPKVRDVGGSRQPKFTKGLTGNPFQTAFEEAFNLRDNKGHMLELNKAVESQLNSQVAEFKVDPSETSNELTINQTYNEYKNFLVNMDSEQFKEFMRKYVGQQTPSKELYQDEDDPRAIEGGPRAIEGGPSGHGISHHVIEGKGIDHVEHFAKMHDRYKQIPLSKRYKHVQSEKNNDISSHMPIAKGILRNHLKKINNISSMNDVKFATNLATIKNKPMRFQNKKEIPIDNCDHCGETLYNKQFMVHKDQDTNPIKGGVICDTCFRSKTMLPNSRKRLTKEAYEPAIESNTNTARGIQKKIHNKMIEPFKGVSNDLSSTSTLWNSFVSTIPSRYNADNVIKKCSTDILLSNNESVSDIDFDYYIIMLAYNTFTDQSNAILTANMFSIAYKYAQQHKIEYVKFVRVAFTKFHDFNVLKEYIQNYPQVTLILIPHNE